MTTPARTHRHAPSFVGLAQRVVTLLREGATPRDEAPTRPARLVHHRTKAAPRVRKRT